MKIVVKVGSSTLTYATGRINIRHMEEFVKVLSDLKNAGHEIILVSSGAIAMGMGKMDLSARPRDTAGKQAAAAVGQCALMYVYDKLFSEHDHSVAQILLTSEDLRDEKRHKNFENTLNRLLELHIVPIINENDTVTTEEISLSDNDTLSALVACSVGADLLILLTDRDGLYTANPSEDPGARLIGVVEEITPEIEALGGGSSSSLGTGGMITKIGAAKTVTAKGIDAVIANGHNPQLLYDILEGKQVGTLFKGKKL